MPSGAPEGMCPACLLGLGAFSAKDADSGMPGPEGASPPSTLGAGSSIGGYALLREIGRGGMGVVYEARHTGLNRKVALKVLPWAELATAEQRERFRREAEAAARLQHPHIVSVYEWGHHDTCPYMAMQLVEGARSLADDLVRGPMNQRHAAELMAKVARAVHFSHQHGILHRDLKPGNILLDASGEPLLVDFGLARMDDAAFRLTHSDLIFGTPAYMPPEQAAGGDITTASDVYGLGAVLYEALAGHPPFQGKTAAETMHQVLQNEPAPPRQHRAEVNRDLESICLKCLEKKPARRYESALELAEDLEHWLKDMPIRARASTITSRAVKWARRRPGVAGLSAALILTALAGLAGIAMNWREAVEARKDQTEQLRRSLLSEARALRASHQPGQRFAAIEVLQRAAAIRPSIDLQNEAVAALAVADLRPAEQWEGNPAGWATIAISTDFRYNAHALADGTVVVSEREGMKPLATLPAGDASIVQYLIFSPDGRWLATAHGASGAERTVSIWD